jgi:Bifunctional DNA primase/polymerase, N-terminal
MLSEAAAYAVNGWPVFSLAGKIPYEGTHGLKEATTNIPDIERFWTQHPKANIGLATGRRSGILVLDMDVPEGYYSLKELQQQYGSLPETRTVRTVNKGLHYYFAYPTDGKTYSNVVGLTNHIGLDVRGEGGYVVSPPSRLYGKKYYTWVNPDTPIAPLPDWLHKLLPTKGEQRKYPHEFGFAGQSGGKWVDEAVAKATEGNRNQMGFWLACQLRDDVLSEAEATQVVLTFANRVPQDKSIYSSQEAVASVRSAYHRSPRERARKI